jgi:hypothetical protein
MRTLAIYGIPVMIGHKQDTCSYMVEQLFFGSHVNKL